MTTEKYPTCPECWQEIKQWKPTRTGDRYYCIADNTVYSQVWSNDKYDRRRYAIGNCFETREGAECCLWNFIDPAFKKYHKLQRSGGAEC